VAVQPELVHGGGVHVRTQLDQGAGGVHAAVLGGDVEHEGSDERRERRDHRGPVAQQCRPGITDRVGVVQEHGDDRRIGRGDPAPRSNRR
jgi:hypothetical protein